MNPIKIISQNIFKELSTSSVNWLLANVGDKLRIETTFEVQNYAISSFDFPFILNNTDGLVGAGWVTDTQNQFASFNIGDSILFFNQSAVYSATFTIKDKLDDNNIQVAEVIPNGNNQSLDNFIISNKTPITAIKYHYNFIENASADTFKSQYDGSEQILSINSISAAVTTPVNMVFNGLTTYRSGSATIEGVSIDTGSTDGVYKSKFIIKHYITLTPFLLYNEVDNYISGIAPNNYKYDNCTKFISQIEAAQLYTNPNFLVSEIFSSVKGNTGFFNENYNGGNTNYSITDLKYINAGKEVTEAQFNSSETSFSFLINNTSNVFDNSHSKIELGFCKVPFEDTEYTLNSNTLDENFCFDRCVQTVGVSAVNGANYATDYKVFKTVTVTYVDAATIRVSGIIAMGSKILARLLDSFEPRYMIFVSTQNYTLDTNNALNDLAVLQVDFNTMAVNTTDTSMIVSENVFLRHYEADSETEGVSLDLYRDSLTVESFNTALKPVYMAYNSFSETIYVLNANSDNIQQFDLNGNIIDTITHVSINNLFCCCYDSTWNRVFITDNDGNQIWVINCVDNSIALVSGTFARPTGIIYNKLEDKIYASDNASSSINIIKGSDLSVTSVLTPAIQPLYLALNTSNNSIYIANGYSNKLDILNCTTLAITQITLPTGALTSAIEYNSIMNYIYVVDTFNVALYTIDCSTNTVIHTENDISYRLKQMSFDATNNRLYFLNIAEKICYINCYNNEIINVY